MIPAGALTTKSTRPPNWGFIDRMLVRECNVASLQACLDLTIPDIQTLMSDCGPTEAEPDWFLRDWIAGDPPAKLRALQKLLGGDR